MLYWRNRLLKNRVGRSVICFFYPAVCSFIHTYPVYIFIKTEKIQAEIETHAWNIENRPYNFYLNCFMKISYDNCAISYENCIIKKKKLLGYGGIFRVCSLFKLLFTVLKPKNIISKTKSLCKYALQFQWKQTLHKIECLNTFLANFQCIMWFAIFKICVN